MSVGSDVFVVASPAGYEGTLTIGIVSSIRDSGQGHKLIQLDAAISSGSSGGGVFNENGQLIGIVVGTVRSAQKLNFAIPINYVRGMMDNDTRMTLDEYLSRGVRTQSVDVAPVAMDDIEIPEHITSIMGRGEVEEVERGTYAIREDAKGYAFGKKPPARFIISLTFSFFDLIG